MPIGKLIAETPALTARSDIIFTGMKARPENFPGNEAAILHAKFEGAGVWILFVASMPSLLLAATAFLRLKPPTLLCYERQWSIRWPLLSGLPSSRTTRQATFRSSLGIQQACRLDGNRTLGATGKNIKNKRHLAERRNH
jgi:hypothetical protein